MKTTSFLLYQATLFAYCQAALEHYYPDQYPVWYLLGLWAVANILRWYSNDFVTKPSFTLLVVTGFVYGLLFAIFQQYPVLEMLVASFISLCFLFTASLAAEYSNKLLYDSDHRRPLTSTVTFCALLLLNLYTMWPLLSKITTIYFLPLLLFSPIAYMALCFGLFFGIERIFSRINAIYYARGYLLKVFGSAILLFAGILMLFAWLVTPTTPWFDHLITSLVISLISYGSILSWWLSGPNPPQNF